MRKAALSLLALLLLAMTPGAAQAPTVFYLSPDGDDAAPGTREQPFASLQRALDAAGRGDTVRVKGGFYALEGPVKAQGKGGVVLEAEAGAEPVFRGSTPVKGWKRCRDPRILRRLPREVRNKIWQTDLKAQGIPDLGDPVKDRHRPALYCDRWAQEKAPWAGGYWFFDWTDSYKPITRIDAAARVMEVPGKRFRHGLRFYGLNLLCEIDAPGEWYLDRDSGILYWYAPEGTDPATAGTTLSMLGAKYMLTLEDCENVTLRGLSFCESRGGALRVGGGRDVSVLDCRMENLGAAALLVDGGERCRIDGCVLRHLEASGITMRGGDRARFVRADHVCANTLVEDYERFHRTYNGAFTADGCGITIHHCVLREGPSSALSLAGNDLVAEFNRIERVARESDDQGGFDLYLNPSMRGIIMRWNHWRDIRGGTRYGVAGIRLDDLISGVEIRGNLFERCGSIEFGGVQIHGGCDNLIEENVFYDCPYAVSFTPYGDSLWQATWDGIRERICREVDMTSEAFLIRYPEARGWGERIDVNVVRSNLLVDCGALYFRATTPQIEGGNVSVSSGGRSAAHFCTPEVLRPLGIRESPFREIGILKNQWLKDE